MESYNIERPGGFRFKKWRPMESFVWENHFYITILDQIGRSLVLYKMDPSRVKVGPEMTREDPWIGEGQTLPSCLCWVAANPYEVSYIMRQDLEEKKNNKVKLSSNHLKAPGLC